MVMKLLRITACLLCAFAIASCATPIKNIKEESNFKPGAMTANSSYVFGRVQWFENGKQKAMTGAFGSPLAHILYRIEDRKRIRVETDKSGRFIWELTPGTYVISRLNYWDTWSGSHFVVPKVAFRVPAKGHVYYIGTLKADLSTKRDFIGGISGSTVHITVNGPKDNDYAFAAEKLRIPPEDIKQSLMVHDARLPRTFDTTREFNIGIQILNAIFMSMPY